MNTNTRHVAAAVLAVASLGLFPPMAGANPFKLLKQMTEDSKSSENERAKSAKARELVASVKAELDAGTLVPETHLKALLDALAAASVDDEAKPLIEAIDGIGDAQGISPPAVKAYLREKAPPVVFNLATDLRFDTFVRSDALMTVRALEPPDEVIEKAIEIANADQSPRNDQREFMASRGEILQNWLNQRKSRGPAPAAARPSTATSVDPAKRKAALALLRERRVTPDIDNLSGEASRLHFDTVEALMDAGIDVDARGNGGVTAFGMSFSLCNEQPDDVVRMMRLLAGRGADVEGTDDKGNTFLMSAVNTCGRVVVAGLLDVGAKANPPPNKVGPGTTPLMMAIFMNKADVAELLVDRGARLHKGARIGDPQDARMKQVVKRARGG